MTDDTRPPRPMPKNLRLFTGRPARAAPAPKPKRQARCPPPPARLSPAAAEIWRTLAKVLWVREPWCPEYALAFSTLCALQARFDADPDMPASLVSQLRLLQVEFGLTPRSRRARLIERDGT